MLASLYLYYCWATNYSTPFQVNYLSYNVDESAIMIIYATNVFNLSYELAEMKNKRKAWNLEKYQIEPWASRKDHLVLALPKKWRGDEEEEFEMKNTFVIHGHGQFGIKLRLEASLIIVSVWGASFSFNFKELKIRFYYTK